MFFSKPSPSVRRRPALQSGEVVEVCGVPVRLRVLAQARRVSLKLDLRAREVIATAPSASRLTDALQFAEQRADWMSAQLAKLPQPLRLAPGLVLNVDGVPTRLEKAAMRISPRLKPALADAPARLIASGEGEAYARAVVRALKSEALARVMGRTELYAARLGRACPEVSVADAKGRWGSCRPAFAGKPAQIRYSWRLILAPPTVLDYVCAHECAHLIEANHSPAFWEVTAKLYPEVKKARAWLRAHGASLHAVC